MKLLKQNLKSQPTGPPRDTESVAPLTLDLLNLVLPHLSPSDSTGLFALCLSSDVLETKDNAVQKRGYKILAKAAASGEVTINAEETLQRLEKLADGLAAAAKKVSGVGFLSLSSVFSNPSQ